MHCYNVKLFRGLSVCTVYHMLEGHTHTDPHKSLTPLWPELAACQQSAPFQSSSSISSVMDKEGGWPPCPASEMMGAGRIRSVPLPLQNSCIKLPQQCPILYNRKKPCDRFCMGLCSHAWCFRQGSMKSDPQVNDIPIPLKVPSGLPCLNMQTRLLPAKWPVTQIYACVCIFIPLSLEVWNICLFKMLVTSGWEAAVLKQDQVL